MANDFEMTLVKFCEEAEVLQKKELALKGEQQLFMQKWVGFMKESGLPEDFTMPEMALLAIKKSRSLITV